MHNNQIEEAYALAVHVPQNQSAVDKSCAFIMQYFPDYGDGGSTAGVRYTNGQTMAFSVDGSAATGGDACYAGDTDGFIDGQQDSYDTVGEVQDVVNGFAAWKMILNTALRADSMTYILTQSAGTCGSDGLPFYHDTSACAIVGAAITGSKFVSNGKAGYKSDADDECINELLYLNIKLTFSSVGTSLKFYTGAHGKTEVQVGSNITLTTATAKEVGEADLTEVYVKSKRGERLIVRSDCDSVVPSTSAPSAVTFNLLGRTAVLSGSRFVDSDNFS